MWRPARCPNGFPRVLFHVPMFGWCVRNSIGRRCGPSHLVRGVCFHGFVYERHGTVFVSRSRCRRGKNRVNSSYRWSWRGSCMELRWFVLVWGRFVVGLRQVTCWLDHAGLAGVAGVSSSLLLGSCGSWGLCLLLTSRWSGGCGVVDSGGGECVLPRRRVPRC